MEPTKEQLERLKHLGGDSEAFHSEFDDILEERLMELDPEWMKGVQKVYEDSRASRWCA